MTNDLAFEDAAKKAYDAATELWFTSGVERHAEGHPGIPGPCGDGTLWDINEAHLEGAISTLKEIRDRLYSKTPE
jgi:hypothetical protein